MKIKLINIIPALLLPTFCATSCGLFSSKDVINRDIIVRGLEDVNDDDNKNVVDLCTLPLSFIYNDFNIPYVAMSNLPSLLRVYIGEALNGNFYDFKSSNHVYTITHPFNNATLTIDFNKGECTYSDRLQFYNLYSSSYGYDDPLLMLDHEEEMGESGKEEKATILSHTHTKGNTFISNFKDYGIEGVTLNRIDYIPFKIAVDILKDTYETNYIYNGDKIYQITNVLEIDQQEKIIKEFKDGWCIEQNNQSFLTFAYNELCYYLSQHYGLRKNTREGREHDITDFCDFCEEFIYPGDREPISKQFIKSNKDFNIACAKLFGYGIPDAGHTVFTNPIIDGEGIKISDYYAPCNKKDYKKCDEERVKKGIINEDGKIIKKYQYFKANGTGANNVSEADTLFYTFDEFEHVQVSDCAEILEIVNFHSNIKNVVLDISCNGGGYIFTLPFIISMLNGSCTLALKDPLTNEKSATKYEINFKNSTKDNLASMNINRYILTSPISFSCGNALPCLAKEGGTKIIGQTSGGGCCSVAYGVTCLGGLFVNSSNMMMCYGDTWGSIEDGAPVDEVIADTGGTDGFYDELCDRSSIVKNIIHKA